MIAKRIAALAATVALILGAIVIRDRLIDDDGTDSAERAPSVTGELVCATELADACRGLDISGLTVRVEDAGATLDRLRAIGPNEQAPLWLTFEPFPAMVDVARSTPGSAVLALDPLPIASSPIGLVTAASDAPTLAECGNPVSWRCLGDSDLATGFARSTDSGIGLLAVAQAAVGFSSSGQLALTDAQFQRWLRTVVTTVPGSRLSGGTAITTIQVRSSSMDVAAGALAELGASPRADFTVQYASPMIRADVVLAVPSDSSVPDGLEQALSVALSEAGWDDPGTTTNPLPDAGTMTAIRTLWKELA